MKNTLIIFISFSTLAHGVVLSGIYNQTENPVFEPPHKKQGGITVNVNISKPIIITKAPLVTVKKINNTKSKDVLQISTLEKHNKNIDNVFKHQLTSSQLQPQVSIKKTINKADGETISKLLHTEFKKYFYYPKAGQRHNWQGIVILHFIIQPNGKIKHVKVSKSSGYAVLDNAAIGALKKIDTGNEFVVALNGQSIEHELPVIYKLTQ